ncbi:hypothetical protein BD560DRAFT_429246 [Blakeslea trispora]|nr:hypothetical protein BD560DRAFT_429246 [Blakeslea trispora]
MKKINNYTIFEIISNGDDYTNMRLLLIASNMKQRYCINHTVKCLFYEEAQWIFKADLLKTILSLSKEQHLAEFKSDLLEIKPMNDKIETRGKVISKGWQFYSKIDAIIVNIISGERINSSYISKALWMIKDSLKGIMFLKVNLELLLALTENVDDC